MNVYRIIMDAIATHYKLDGVLKRDIGDESTYFAYLP